MSNDILMYEELEFEWADEVIESNVSNQKEQNQSPVASHISHSHNHPNPSAIFNYMTLALILVPLGSAFGNTLVVLSVLFDRQLRSSTTNFFILSLAIADFAVSICVMPFAIYNEVSFFFLC